MLGSSLSFSEYTSYDRKMKTNYPMYGYFSQFAYNRAYCEVETINQAFNYLCSYTRTNEIDELGKCVKKEISKAGNRIISNELIYKKNNNSSAYVSNLISEERLVFSSNDTHFQRSYNTNSIGCVTEINDSKFGSFKYEYDYRGYLTKESNNNTSTTYEYDKLGNLTKAGNKVFTYDSIKKFNLTKANGKNVIYDISSPGNIIRYGTIEYKYMGRRLIQYVNHINAYDKEELTFEYNDKGLRTKKIYRKTSVNYSKIREYTYEYEGTNLIYEITPEHRNQYLYDENGEMYGFIQDNEKTYFYIKDYLSNILGFCVSPKLNMTLKKVKN